MRIGLPTYKPLTLDIHGCLFMANSSARTDLSSTWTLGHNTIKTAYQADMYVYTEPALEIY